MKKIIAHPGITHRGLRRSGFQGGMRFNQCHHRCPAAIRNSEHAHAPIIVADIFEQPVNRVVCIRRFVYRFGIIFIFAQRTIHHEFAFGFIASANVLKNKNVTVFDEFFLRGIEVFALMIINAIGRAIHQERQRLSHIFRRENHRMQFGSIAHQNHHLSFFEGDYTLVLFSRRSSLRINSVSGKAQSQQQSKAIKLF